MEFGRGAVTGLTTENFAPFGALSSGAAMFALHAGRKKTAGRLQA
jgi:hypothetical protein